MGGAGFTQVIFHARGRFDAAQPAEYEDVELGDGRVIRCVLAALMLARWNGAPVALIISNEQGGPYGQLRIRIERVSPDPEIASRLLAELRAAMLEHNVFRDKAVSLGLGGSIRFPTIPEVREDAVVLPDGTLERLERHAIGITEQELRRAGRRRDALTRRLLGQGDGNRETPPPSQSMLRAITASGLPLPPGVHTHP